MFMLHEEGDVFKGYTVFVLFHATHIQGGENLAEQETMKSPNVPPTDLTQHRFLTNSHFDIRISKLLFSSLSICSGSTASLLIFFFSFFVGGGAPSHLRERS